MSMHSCLLLCDSLRLFCVSGDDRTGSDAVGDLASYGGAIRWARRLYPPMTLEKLARSDVITASPETDVRKIARLMNDELVGSVVVTEGDDPIGIVTDRDLALGVLLEERDPDATTAADVMSDGVHTIDVDAGFYEATQRMNEANVRRLPVVDDGGLVGIITLDDLSELLADEQSELVGVIREQRAPY